MFDVKKYQRKYHKKYYKENAVFLRAQRRIYNKKGRKELARKNPILARLGHKKWSAIKRKGLNFTLDANWAKANYTGCCALTGIKFDTKSKITPFSATIDRINNKKGYTEENSRIILFGVNALKGTGTDEDVLKIAKALVKVLTKRNNNVTTNGKKRK